MKEKTLTHLFFASAVLYVCLLTHLHFPMNTMLKPLPIIILMWWVRVYMPTNTQWAFLFWALVLSVGGDMTLTFSGQESFLAGLSLFLCAHLCFIAFFFSKPDFKAVPLIIIATLVGFATFMFHRFSPHLGEMYYPVMFYMTVLILMVSMALLGKENVLMSKCGALLFLSSDSLLATQLFLKPDFPLAHAIIVTYYLAQFFIVRGALKTVKTATA